MKFSIILSGTKFSFDLLLLVLFLFLPSKLVFFIIFSVFFHELGHYLVANIFKYPVSEFRISLFGSFVQFEQKIINPIHSLLISLSGPFMNFLLAIYAYNLKMIDFFSINVLLLLINMLPLRSTDGNFALKSILDILSIRNSQKISDIIGIISSGVFILLFLLIGEYILAISLALMILLTNFFR